MNLSPGLVLTLSLASQLLPAPAQLSPPPISYSDCVIRNAKVITVDAHFSIAEAVAIVGGKIQAVGNNQEISKFIGPNTRIIDAKGKTILPGLCDSHVHSYRAAVSEFNGATPALASLADAFRYIKQKAATQPPGSWITLERVYPTRMKEGRLPTKAELDAAAPDHPVYWNCGPVSIANSKALEISAINRETPNPSPGEIVKDPTSGVPTGLLRNAAQLLKITAASRAPTAEEQREAVKHLHQLYNRQGITSIAERRTEFAAIDLFRNLAKSRELTVRVNCTRLMEPVPKTRPEALAKLDELTHGVDGKGSYGPTGVGDDWVRIGPLKVFLDGGMLIGTAFMREPWGVGDTYQITDPNYRGLLNVQPELLRDLYLEAAKRGWQLAAHCTGEASVDVLLDCYQSINRETDIRARRFEICHANFQSEKNLARSVDLGIVADIQPAWLYKDGASLLKTLGERRMKWFLPLKSWVDHGLTIGGGSDHMVVLDSMAATNPWNPWLGMWIALTRHTERGGVHNPKERLSREQAIRLYTFNNARLTFDEAVKGSLEPGKYADLIMIDRDILKCPVNDVKNTKVLLTMIDGKVVWEQ
jgi:predicted amidohydrolase YtcJ